MTSLAELPDAVTALFDGTGLKDKQNAAAILATTDEDGWPRLAYLSAGEVLVHDPNRLSISLWPTSSSTLNLLRTGRGVLQAAARGAVWEARLNATRRQTTNEGPAVFDAEVVEVRRNAAPYADVEWLIAFRLHDAPAAVERWERQIGRMRPPT
jgi:flavin reductase (DIM6/NTAB) family NADH-FMN oxidoreductase RutF